MLARQGPPGDHVPAQRLQLPAGLQTIVTLQDSLTNHKDELKALLIGDIKGWRASLKDPTTGAELAVNTFGKDQKLDITTQTAQSKAQNKLILDSRTIKEGIFTVPPAMQASTCKTLALGGTNITPDKLFDMSLLNEIYQENPDLMTDPTS